MKHQFRSSNLIRKRRQKRLVKGTLVFFGFLILFLTPVFLSRSPYFAIKEIDVRGAALVWSDEIKAVAQDQISGNYLGLYPRSNALIFPEERIENILLRKLPRIAGVSVSTEKLKTMVIEVVERKPEFIWCKSESKECYFLDERGLAFDTAADFSPGTYFRYETETFPETVLGSFILDEDLFLNVKNFLEGVRALSLKPQQLILEGSDGHLVLEGGAEIVFEISDDLTKALSNLESVLSDPKLKIQEEGDVNVSIIDLRFGNKVFYQRDTDSL